MDISRKIRQHRFLILLCFVSWHFFENHIYFQWAVGSAIATIYLFWKFRHFLPVLPSAILIYTILWTCYLLAFNERSEMFTLNALYYTFCLVLISAYAWFLDMSQLKDIFFHLPLFTFLNVCYIMFNYWILEGYRNKIGSPGFLNYPGMNGCLLACTIPSILSGARRPRKLKILYFLFCVFGIYACRSSIPYGVAFFSVAAFVFHKHRKLLSVIPVFALIAVVSILSEGIELLDSAGRFEAYTIFMSEWWVRVNHFFGSGPGTFITMGPAIQKLHNFMPIDGGGFWLWTRLHEEYLQITFEIGYVGLFLYLGLLFRVLLVMWQKRESDFARVIFSTMVGLAASAIFNYPGRYFVTALLVCLCVSASYKFRTEGA